jgi:hypothetical protein
LVVVFENRAAKLSVLCDWVSETQGFLLNVNKNHVYNQI